jgi:predicted Zn-dependent protease
MHTEDISPSEARLVEGTLEDILQIAGVQRRIKVKNLGIWRHPKWLDEDGYMIPHRSVDWYFGAARDNSRGQVKTDAVLNLLSDDPWQENEPHYDALITKEDLFGERTNFVLGSTRSGRATVLSFNRLRDRETKKQLVYHEVGHMFGLPVPRAEMDNRLGDHCVNLCAMRQGMTVGEWDSHARDRSLTNQVYCKPCDADLREYFKR